MSKSKMLIFAIILILVLCMGAYLITIGMQGTENKNVVANNTNTTNNTSNNTETKETGTVSTAKSDFGKIDKNGIYTESSTVNGKVANVYNPIIPEGFKPIDNRDNVSISSEASWGEFNQGPSKEAVEAGLVIEDTYGNQFVWVPVDGTVVNMARRKFAGSSSTKVSRDEAVQFNTSVLYYGEEDKNSCVYGTDYNIDNQLNSINKNGGFYIARYEAGTNSIRNEETENLNTVFSKAEKSAYNFVTRDQALELSQNMYKDNKSIKSTLVSSYAWDTTLKYLSAFSKYNDYPTNINLGNLAKINGTRIAYSELKATGKTIEDEVCNIFDLSGNVSEWTTEYYRSESTPNVLRGASFAVAEYGASYRYDRRANFIDQSIGFRVMLYIEDNTDNI